MGGPTVTVRPPYDARPAPSPLKPGWVHEKHSLGHAAHVSRHRVGGRACFHSMPPPSRTLWSGQAPDLEGSRGRIERSVLLVFRHRGKVDPLEAEPVAPYPTKVSDTAPTIVPGYRGSCDGSRTQGERPTTRIQKGLERLLVAYCRRQEHPEPSVMIQQRFHRRD